MKMTRLTPVLVVDVIEPVLGFWDLLGFSKTAEVPHEGALGFVILERDSIQIMYQSRASVAADVPALASKSAHPAYLFIEVDDLDAVIARLGGITPALPRRKTFYGSDEYIVRDPAGNTVTFAQFGKEQ
jgi:uncharacterized glyoxalase superfamily protein PhnB